MTDLQASGLGSVYNDDFYLQKRKTALESATRILGLLKGMYPFASVIDVGAGDCVWGKACETMGVNDYLGVDGGHAKGHLINGFQQKFLPIDLECDEIEISRRYDLVISLEVAEHLRPENSDRFIKTLTALGDVILFSAAVPGQGGTNHVNEQWQSYWQSHFSNHGFMAFDLMRPLIWNEPMIAEYYRQNTIVYCSISRPDLLDMFRMRLLELPPLLDVIHPVNYDRIRDLRNAPLIQFVESAPAILSRVIVNRLFPGRTN